MTDYHKTIHWQGDERYLTPVQTMKWSEKEELSRCGNLASSLEGEWFWIINEKKSYFDSMMEEGPVVVVLPRMEG